MTSTSASEATGRFTFVIPTIWAPGKQFVERLVKDLDRSPWVERIILIDNAPKSKKPPFDFPKLVWVSQKKNLYVNASWNLGVGLARTDLIALCNDDINTDWSLLEHVSRELRKIPANTPAQIPPAGGFPAVIGMGKNAHLSATAPSFEPVESRPLGFGMCMFMTRDSFFDIPAELRVWCGDDFLFDVWRARHQEIFALSDWAFELAGNTMSVSSAKRRFKRIRKRDLQVYISNGAQWVHDVVS